MKITKLFIVVEIVDNLIDWDKKIPIPRIGELIQIGNFPLREVSKIKYSSQGTMMEIKIITKSV